MRGTCNLEMQLVSKTSCLKDSPEGHGEAFFLGLGIISYSCPASS